MKIDGKQKRIVAAIAAGGLLALVVLLSRKNGSAEAGQASGVANDPNSTGLPTSFADNGAAMGQLSTSIADLTGRVDTGLGQFGDALAAMDDRAATRDAASRDSMAAAITGLGTLFAAAQHDPPAPAPPAQLIYVGQPQAPASQPAQVASAVQVPALAHNTLSAGPNVVSNSHATATTTQRGNVVTYHTTVKGP